MNSYHYTIGLIGVWLFCDGWFSLALYIGKPNQGWLKDHSIRILRCMIGVTMIIIGAVG